MSYLMYHESQQRGSLDFPLDYHYVDECHPRYDMPFHWHEEYEILHVLHGEFHLAVDEDVRTLRSGDVAFIAAGSLHGAAPIGCVYECVVFDMRLLLKSNDHCKQYIGDILHRRITVHTHFPADSVVTRYAVLPMFEALRERCEGYELVTLGCLFQFVGKVFQHGTYDRHPKEAAVDQKKALQLKKVFELIETQYPSPLTLAELAGSVHMTPKYFCRFFKSATHRSPMDYLNYYRVEMASYALVATDCNVSEAASGAGFNNLSYFIRVFKRHKGMTPGQYVARARKE